ncbi:MAG: hypothetical protein AABY32_05025 [Nanoarchaeota archaeon]
MSIKNSLLKSDLGVLHVLCLIRFASDSMPPGKDLSSKIKVYSDREIKFNFPIMLLDNKKNKYQCINIDSIESTKKYLSEIYKNGFMSYWDIRRDIDYDGKTIISDFPFIDNKYNNIIYKNIEDTIKASAFIVKYNIQLAYLALLNRKPLLTTEKIYNFLFKYGLWDNFCYVMENDNYTKILEKEFGAKQENIEDIIDSSWITKASSKDYSFYSHLYNFRISIWKKSKDIIRTGPISSGSSGKPRFMSLLDKKSEIIHRKSWYEWVPSFTKNKPLLLWLDSTCIGNKIRPISIRDADGFLIESRIPCRNCSPSDILKSVIRLRANWLWGFSNLLFWLSRECEKQKIIKPFDLVVSTGCTLRPYWKEHILKYLSKELVEVYGNCELGCIGFPCKDNLHLRTDMVSFENKEYKYNLKETYFSCLYNTFAPLVDVQSFDWVEVGGECNCGSKYPVIKSIKRLSDYYENIYLGDNLYIDELYKMGIDAVSLNIKNNKLNVNLFDYNDDCIRIIKSLSLLLDKKMGSITYKDSVWDVCERNGKLQTIKII